MMCLTLILVVAFAANQESFLQTKLESNTEADCGQVDDDCYAQCNNWGCYNVCVRDGGCYELVVAYYTFMQLDASTEEY